MAITKQENRIEIKKLILKIGEKDIALTMDEARQLKEVLKALFGDKDSSVAPILIPYPYPEPYRPQPMYPPSTPWYWCENSKQLCIVDNASIECKGDAGIALCSIS